jgi:hypothetical protein
MRFSNAEAYRVVLMPVLYVMVAKADDHLEV